MNKFLKKLPVFKQINSLNEEVARLTAALDAQNEILRKTQDELSIHGEVIGNISGDVKRTQDELSIHGEVIGNVQNELSIHGQVIGNAQNELSTHGEAIGIDREKLEKLVSDFCSAKSRINQIERMAAEKTIITQSQITITGDAANQQLIPETKVENSYYSIDYFDFENHFRGSRESIMERQKMYLPYFKDCKNVLDVGCGRGEFVELLVKEGIGVTGVDLYEPYVEYCKMQGLPCECGDANAFLASTKDVDGIFLGQVVEHMTVSQIIELTQNAFAALKDGSYLIMETPNPMSLSTFTHAFYMDPSHEKPVHPYTLKYLTEKAGFSSVEILFTDCSRMPVEIPELKVENADLEAFNKAMKQLSEDIYGSQDYAIIARK